METTADDETELADVGLHVADRSSSFEADSVGLLASPTDSAGLADHDDDMEDPSASVAVARDGAAVEPRPLSSRAKWSTVLVVGILFIIVFVVVLTKRRGSRGGDELLPEGADAIRQFFLGIPSAEQAKAHQYMYTRRPSLAGTAGDYQTVQDTKRKMEEFGIPHVEILSYDVLLSYPLHRNLSIVGPAGKEFVAGLQEQPVSEDPTSNDPDSVPTFNAYSASGDVTANVVYVNFGTFEDYDALNKSGADLNGKIAIARYGRNFRGLKAMIGELFNISGLLIYSDPQQDGFRRGEVYPDGPFRPRSGVQRGSAQYISLYSGDPLTPGVAAVHGASINRQYTAQNAPTLPRIPILPISWGDAEPILRGLQGPTVDEAFGGNLTHLHFQGGLNFTYRLGDVFSDGNSSHLRVRLHTKMNNSITTIWNVIGTINGTSPVENHKKVIIGNHRDAWVFGSVDPHSGSAALLEVARGLGALVNSGWLPQRTIKLCSWDAEEYGLVGSVEYAEQFKQDFSANAVAYINVDVGVEGPVFRSSAVPSLTTYIRNATKYVVNPATGRTIYQEWQQSQNKSTEEDPYVGPLGSGSDYTPFLQYLGIASADIRFVGHDYGVYHSIYDSYYWMEHFGDPTWEYHKMIAQIWGVVVLFLADDAVLQYNYVEYHAAIDYYYKQLVNTKYPAAISAHGIPASTKAQVDGALNTVHAAVDAFGVRCGEVQKEIARVTAASAADPSGRSIDAQWLNNRLVRAERMLLANDTLPDRPVPWYKHVIYAPSLYGGYSASVLPGITQALDDGNWVAVLAWADHLTDRLQAAADVLHHSAQP